MTKFVAGWNMPGYLPEAEPAEFETFDEAKQYIIDTLKRFEDEEGAAENEDAATKFCHAAEDANLESRPFAIQVNSLVFWVEKGEP